MHLASTLSASSLLDAVHVPRDASSECSLGQNDPASWQKSNAPVFMQNWFNTNGTSNWLEDMDNVTTTINGFTSTLDCRDLTGNSCPAPTTPCIDFTPPELHLIRIGATNANKFFTGALSDLTATTIIDNLAIPQMLIDFAPDPPPKGFNFINGVAAGFFVAAPLAALVPGVGAILGPILGLIGGMLNLANAVTNGKPAPASDHDALEAVISNSLGATFDAGQNNLKDFNDALFGGSNNNNFDLGNLVGTMQNLGSFPQPSNVVGVTNPNPILQIFATGAFQPEPDFGTLNTGLQAGLLRIKQNLVGLLLQAQNFFIFIDDTLGEGDCGITGSRFVQNKCMIISQRSSSNDDGDPDHNPVDANILLKLDDPNAGYNIDVNEFYENAYACNGSKLDTTFTATNDLPKCFFSLPILEVSGNSVCSLIPSGLAAAPGFAAGVQLTLAAC